METANLNVEDLESIISKAVELRLGESFDDPEDDMELNEELVEYLILHRGDKNGTSLEEVMKELEEDNIIR
ncbi:MAG: hypothetical protein HQK89_07810 [Nitrospirae bacterium]|nr:hypothetical protein [Nitrospirota bacterium]